MLVFAESRELDVFKEREGSFWEGESEKSPAASPPSQVSLHPVCLTGFLNTNAGGPLFSFFSLFYFYRISVPSLVKETRLGPTDRSSSSSEVSRRPLFHFCAVRHSSPILPGKAVTDRLINLPGEELSFSWMPGWPCCMYGQFLSS